MSRLWAIVVGREPVPPTLDAIATGLLAVGQPDHRHPRPNGGTRS